MVTWRYELNIDGEVRAAFAGESKDADEALRDGVAAFGRWVQEAGPHPQANDSVRFDLLVSDKNGTGLVAVQAAGGE